MKLLLISPKSKMKESMKNGRGFQSAQMTLAHLAALVPPDVETQLVDEILSEVPFDTDADLVGITTMTHVAERAYEISDEYRRRGVPVVMGGVHPTVCPEEAGSHCDAIVMGEAEGLMERLIEDFNRGCLKRAYRRETPPDLAGLPLAKRDLIDRKYWHVHSIQVARGCPNNCSFCVVPQIYGRRYRPRPVDDVIREIEGLDGDKIFFLDDSLVVNRRYSVELLSRMAPLGKKFIGQLSFHVLEDDEMLGLLKRAGAVGFLVGFESVSQSGLEWVGKGQEVSTYYDGIKRFLDHGLSLVGSFIFGLDCDGPDAFERTVEFIDRSGIDIVQLTLLVPFPGTDIYNQLAGEGRLVNPTWWLDSSWNDVVFRPAKMTREELRDGWKWALTESYKLPKIAKRIGRQVHKRPLFTSGVSAWFNLSYRSSIMDFLHEKPALAAQ